jgi:large subunit ribosomal protein L29
MNAQELRDQTIEELMVKEEEVKSELFALVNEFMLMKKLEKPHMIKKLRKDVARIKTIINEKKRVK